MANGNESVLKVFSSPSLRQQVVGHSRWGGSHWEHISSCLWSRVPWVLHSRLVHCWQEADLSLLSRKGRSQENVPKPLGEASHDVRSAVGLGPLVGLLATSHPRPRPGHQLGSWPRVTLQRGCHEVGGSQHHLDLRSFNTLALLGASILYSTALSSSPRHVTVSSIKLD